MTSNDQAASGSPAPSDFIEGTDAFGRRMRFSRDEYRKKVLPGLIEQYGNQPDQLAQVLMQALQQGFAKDLVGAANRLAAIDKDVERSLSLLSVVQRDAGDLEAAEFSLRDLLRKKPASAAASVGLALLADKKGDAAACERLLGEALHKDCNHPDAVHAWLQVRHKHVGDEGYRHELEALCQMPGAWRGKLWRARLDLQQQQPDAAAATYRELLAQKDPHQDVLFMAATDLLNARQHALLDELIAPRFLPGRHHPHIGLALLHHFAATKKTAAGEALLHQMHLHYGQMMQDALQPFTAEFDRQRLAALPAVKPPAQPRVGLFRLEWPAFCAGLADPQWLLPQKQAGHREVLFLGLALDGQPQLPAGHEEEVGRLTRSVPMFLAEHVWLASPHRGTVGLPMAEPGGWVVMGRPWQEEQLVAQMTEADRARTLLVSGLLRIDGERRRIDLWVYDCAKKERVGHAAAEGPQQELGQMLLQLLAELWPLFGGPKDHKPPVGDPAFWARHADGLGQHAALVVTRSGAMPKDRLFGLRYLAQWLQQTALQEPRWQPSFWLYASALTLLHELGSPVPKEHARVVAELFQKTPPNMPFARLAVRPLRAAGLDGIWQARRAEIVAAAGGDLAYGQWLERAEAML